MKALVITLALALTLAACGIKGDPEAPRTEPTEQTQ